MNNAIITENDASAWKDITGELYQFPKRYLKILTQGTRVIYYKGRINDRDFENLRLSTEPHYFGSGLLGKIYPDGQSSKNDYFAQILNYVPFYKPVLAKDETKYFERIPATRITN
jgi:hypothetical protein